MANGVRNGVSFDGKHSYNDFGMYLAARPDLQSPEPKLNTVEVPGMDGLLDMTEANSGDVKFTNRTLAFTFSAIVKVGQQEQFKLQIRNTLHGKRIQRIILDEDPEWYYTGRCSVEFVEIHSWKLKCTVTVDADPYALRVNETVVDLTAADESVLDVIDIPATKAQALNVNTDLRLGTKTFPDGLVPPSAAMNPLFLSTSDNPPKLDRWSLYIEDAAGHTYHSSTATWPPAPGVSEVSFDLSTVVAAGVDLSKVYRVLSSGLGDVRIYWKMFSNKYVVSNSRKSVIPVISLETQENSIEITVNGGKHTIYPGTALYEDIVLGEGENVVNVPIYQIDDFTMTFREGKL